MWCSGAGSWQERHPLGPPGIIKDPPQPLQPAHPSRQRCVLLLGWGLPPFPSLLSSLPGHPKTGVEGEQRPPSPSLAGLGCRQGASPSRRRQTPWRRVPPHCRGEIFRGIIIRDSMVRISGTGKEDREVRAGGPW